MNSYERNVRNIAERVDSFFKSAFTDLIIDGPELDMPFMEKAGRMVTSTHRSQLDYFIAGYLLHHLGLKNMRFAAGDNLTRLPVIGKLFNDLGAFTVERNSVFSKTYVRTLCEQVITMLHKDDTIVVFPEGGRSYKGCMLELKTGIIGAGILAQTRKLVQDMCFLPLAITYEFLPELPYFSMLERGKVLRKTQHNPAVRLLGNYYYFGADILAFSKFFLKHRLGRSQGAVFIDYGTPVRIEDVVDLKRSYNKKARDDFAAFRGAMQAVGECLYGKMFALYRVIPAHILAYILVTRGPCTVDTAVEQTRKVVSDLESTGRNTKSIESLSPGEIVESGMEVLDAIKGISVNSANISIKNSPVVRYYSSTIA